MYKKGCGVFEESDRLASYQHGRAPLLWPSGDTIQFYPKRFQNFPKILQGYIDRMAPDHPSVTTRLTKAGKTVPHLLPWPNPNHVPCVLSDLGRKLLRLEDWNLCDTASDSDSGSDSNRKSKYARFTEFTGSLAAMP